MYRESYDFQLNFMFEISLCFYKKKLLDFKIIKKNKLLILYNYVKISIRLLDFILPPRIDWYKYSIINNTNNGVINSKL